MNPLGVFVKLATSYAERKMVAADKAQEREDKVVDAELEEARKEKGFSREVALQRVRNRGKDDKLAQRGTLIMFSSPFLVAWVNPDLVTKYFNALDLIPDYYKAAFMTMLSVVWGVDQLKRYKAGR